ncbi:MAG: haloacid dehalogenase type II [Myxococcota bacterium]|nr:haloacid dehalogenase type II [Myxococcota bacterium]
MNRRSFVQVLGAGTTLAACMRAAPSQPHSTRIRAVAFDLFTIFDPRSIDAAVSAEVPTDGAALAQLWKLRTFEYCWLRAAADRYLRFDRIVADALAHALATRKLTLDPAAHQRLIAAWTELAPWPDAEASLVRLRDRGLVLAPLANFSPDMIEALLTRAKLRPLFAHVISTDAAASYKPAARAYQLGVDRFALSRSEIAFSAFGGWDAVGATWFGYPTCWVNRLGVTSEHLSVLPEHTGPDLVALADWIAARA